MSSVQVAPNFLAQFFGKKSATYTRVYTVCIKMIYPLN